MRRINCLFVAGLLAAPVLLQAQPTAHYVPGVEGLKAASLPPPGWYLRDYNVAYTSTRLNDPAGTEIGAADADAFIYANVPRLIWISDTKVLGGFLGVDALLPLTYKSIELTPGPVPRYDDDEFGVGDLFAEVTLSWHIKQFDFAVAAGAWAPTGDSGEPVNAGAGYWTPMFTAGATWYIDEAKTWSVSALNRYEINTESRDVNITPGQAYTLEWGIGKALNPGLELGVVGYYQQQLTGDDLNGSTANDRVAAVGPEISLAFPKPMLFVSFRYLYEFMAEDRLQGQTFSLTLTKRF
jgi:hypothetical protein